MMIIDKRKLKDKKKKTSYGYTAEQKEKWIKKRRQ
nr:MAG: hypothetical protein [Helarchaeota virus Nidhogg Meg22_1214]